MKTLVAVLSALFFFSPAYGFDIYIAVPPVPTYMPPPPPVYVPQGRPSYGHHHQYRGHRSDGMIYGRPVYGSGYVYGTPVPSGGYVYGRPVYGSPVPSGGYIYGRPVYGHW